jgi:hypothetical protein
MTKAQPGCARKAQMRAPTAALITSGTNRSAQPIRLTEHGEYLLGTSRDHVRSRGARFCSSHSLCVAQRHRCSVVAVAVVRPGYVPPSRKTARVLRLPGACSSHLLAVAQGRDCSSAVRSWPGAAPHAQQCGRSHPACWSLRGPWVCVPPRGNSSPDAEESSPVSRFVAYPALLFRSARYFACTRCSGRWQQSPSSG